jgi:hypothetical protein
MDELTRIALVGTSKYAGSVAGGGGHPAAALVSDSASDDRERTLLLRCGAQAIYALAGHRSVPGIEPAGPAPAETKRTASSKLAAMLESALAEAGNGPLLDFLTRMSERQVVLPPELLPVLLETKDKAVRECLIPLLGERGAWLCRQNPDWSSFLTAAADDTQRDSETLRRIFDEGSVDERCEALKAQRLRAPETAREWVEKAFPREKHGQRLKLVEALETGLNVGDEPFLESCLDDRSSAVGQAAARLLCLLPESALAKRMRDRAAAVFSIETNGHTHNEMKLVCSPPTEVEPDWQRDGFSSKAPPGVGLRAFSTEHLVASIPPSFWTREFGITTESLIAAVADDAYAESVVAGWTKAAIRFFGQKPASADWLGPLWKCHVRELVSAERETAGAEAGVLKQSGNQMAQSDEMRQKKTLLPMIKLIGLMARDVAEAGIADLMERSPHQRVELVLGMLPALSRPWSAAFSTWFLTLVRSRLQAGPEQSVYRWAVTLGEMALAIHPDAFPFALEPWSRAELDDSKSWFAAAIPRAIDKFMATIEQRQNFLRELNA